MRKITIFWPEEIGNYYLSVERVESLHSINKIWNLGQDNASLVRHLTIN